MKRLRASIATTAVLAVATGGLLVGLAGNAAAAGPPSWETDGTDTASVGGLIFFNSSGAQVSGGNVTDPISAFIQGAATINSGDTTATLYGYLPKSGVAPGGWSGEPLAGPSTYPNASAPATVSPTLPLVTTNSNDLAIADLISDFPNTDPSTTDGYAGLYQLRLKTSGANYDSADIQITGTGASATWAVVYTAPPTTTATSTALTTSPASPQVAGTPVTLNAAVTPATAGTVQFKYGSTNIGSPVTVVAGAASTTTTTLPVGVQALHAVFTPTSAFVAASTGDASFTVTAAPAAPTTTALSVNPTTAAAFTSVTLTANVSKTSDSSALGAAGSVKFFEGGTTLLGSVPLTATGAASLSVSTFAQGTHDITAQFVPADSTVYNTSTSTSVPFVATAPTGPVPDPQTVKVEIPAGSLVITTPYDSNNPFDLGLATLDPATSTFKASAAFGNASDLASGVSITDSRAGDPGWTASASANNFTDGSADVINGENLAFTNLTAVQAPGNALLASSVSLTPVPSTGGYSATDPGTNGLGGGVAHKFASTAVGAGTGSVGVDGTVSLVAPSSTPSGSYTATLTFTIV